MRPLRPCLFIAALGSAGFGPCGSSVLGNTGFDLWCGEELCAWTVEAGEVERVPTWHDRDYAADLIGDDVVLTQRAEVDSGACGGLLFGPPPSPDQPLTLSLLANVESGATITFEVDYDEDGTVEYSQSISAFGPEWVADGGTLYPPPRRDPASAAPRFALFRLQKQGSARALIAQIVVWDDCE
jgi:hypothetical protein